jgi:cystathionine beta-lyase/cystathionine gamma-synthase
MNPEETNARKGPSTRAVHSGSPPAGPDRPVVTPIYQSATFYTDAEPAGEVRYTRYGTNPNHLALAERLAALENTETALVVASGNAAIALSLLSCTGTGDHIVAARSLYGGTLRLLTTDLPALGIETTFVEPGEWADALRPETRAFLMETPVNPTMRVPDIRPVATLARDRGIPLLVDATFATPINFRPAEHGADLVIHSATKYLGGHSDLMAGVVAGPADLVERVRAKLISFGPVLDPHAAWLVERGVKTLAVRMARHNENGLAVARWLESHPAVLDVHYPGLESHPDHAIARELFDGFGGMLALVVRGGDEAALRVMSRLRILCAAPSLGGVETLVSMPRFTSHAALDRQQRIALGVTDGFIRISLGIEDSRDIIEDLDQALRPESQSDSHATRHATASAG